MHGKKIYAKIIVNLLLTIALALFAVLVIPRLLSFFIPFVVAFIISLIANPVVRFMEKRVKIVRKHGSAIIIIVVLAVIFACLYFAFVFLSKQVLSLVADVPNIARALTDLMNELSIKLSKAYEVLPDGLQNVFTNLSQNTETYLAKFLDGIEPPSIPEVGGYVKNFANLLFMAIITILATYFFIADRDKMADFANRMLPDSLKRGYKLVVDNFKNAVGGYFKAQFKIMIVLLLIMFIAFEIMRVEFSFLLALGIAILDFLPVFGTGAILGPWAIIEIISGNYLRAVFIIIIYLACLLIKQLLQPKMVGDSIGISPFATLIFMFIGYRISGVFGMIIGIPIGMVLINFYRIGMFERIIRGFKIIISDINEFRKY
ncbi:sporulation integral membrane protein YtvI [Clostridium sp. Marseille-P299]|uniref:sporulation integral membrane protein YtvI n=1 Tax=Clostridium sp. Marseille-P299 TaxID=1805477 RepID=UPI0008312AEA|nr:sporulation integral membrane protein YtvI [Clostridium sp. Marseille-P299]